MNHWLWSAWCFAFVTTWACLLASVWGALLGYIHPAGIGVFAVSVFVLAFALLAGLSYSGGKKE